MLTVLSQNIWAASGPLRIIGLNLGHRMTVVRLQSGGLWVHSPVELDEAIEAALAPLGPVEYLVAPSRFHDLYLPAWFGRYPEARLVAVPGLAEEHGDWPVDCVLGAGDAEEWEEELPYALIGGIPRLNEAVFFHPASRSLIVADLVFNLEAGSWTERCLQHLNGVYDRIGPSRLFKLFIKDRTAMKASLNDILAWDFDRLIVGHGHVVESGGSEALRRAYAWL